MSTQMGWIRLYREVMNHAVFHDDRLFKVFIYCLLRANHIGGYSVPFKGEKRKLNMGQFITSRHNAARDCFMKETTLYSNLQKLKEWEMIEIDTDNNKTLISIVNWSLFQQPHPDIDKESSTKRKVVDKRPSAKRKVVVKKSIPSRHRQ